MGRTATGVRGMRGTLEPTPASEDRVGLTELDERARERQQIAIGVLPVEPRDVVVLTVAVVVAALRASDLVAACAVFMDVTVSHKPRNVTGAGRENVAWNSRMTSSPPGVCESRIAYGDNVER